MKTLLFLLRLITSAAVAAMIYAAVICPPLAFIAAPGALLLIALAIGV